MKLIIAIVQDEHINKVVKALMNEKIRTTKLASTGGFLKSGNTTLLIGVEDSKIDEVVELIKSQVSSKSIKEGENEVTVGGANLFIVDVDKHVKI